MFQPVIDALLSPLLAWISAHPLAVVITFAAYYVASNAIAALPEPKPDSSAAYQFWFKFLHGLAGNLARFIPWLRFNRTTNPSPGA